MHGPTFDGAPGSPRRIQKKPGGRALPSDRSHQVGRGPAQRMCVNLSMWLVFESVRRGGFEASEHQSIFVFEEPFPLFSLLSLDGFGHGDWEIYVVA